MAQIEVKQNISIAVTNETKEILDLLRLVNPKLGKSAHFTKIIAEALVKYALDTAVLLEDDDPMKELLRSKVATLNEFINP